VVLSAAERANGDAATLGRAGDGTRGATGASCGINVATLATLATDGRFGVAGSDGVNGGGRSATRRVRGGASNVFTGSPATNACNDYRQIAPVP